MMKRLFALSFFLIFCAKSQAAPVQGVSQNSKSGLVLAVEKGSVWEEAGFANGDIIKSINDVSTEHVQNSQYLVDIMRGGAKHFRFNVLRAGKLINVDVAVK